MIIYQKKKKKKKSCMSSPQHGFRARLSCETQLVLTFHDWANILSQRVQVDAPFLDFNKAFEKVSHKKLLYKICQYGINSKTHAWISAFLKNRFQLNGNDAALFFSISHFRRFTWLRARTHPVFVIHQRHCSYPKFSALSLC